MIRLAPLLLLSVIACSDRHPEPPPAPAHKVVEMPRADPPPPPTPSSTAQPGWSSSTVVAHGDAHASSLAIDSGDNVVIAVEYEGRIKIGDQELDGGDGGLALVKVGKDGAIAWVKQIASNRAAEFARIAIDSHDAIVLVASLYASVDLGGGAVASAGDKDILVAKLGPDGSHVWSHRYGASEPDSPADLAIDAKDHIVVGGYYAGTVDFGGKKLTSTNDAEMFVARYTPDGKLVFANRISGGGTELSELYDVAVDVAGNAIAIGAFGGKVQLGSSTLAGDKTKSGQTFVAAFAPNGRTAWSTAYGAGPLTLMNVVAVTRAGAVILAGSDMHMQEDENHMVSFETSTGQPTQGSMTTALAALGPDHKTAWSLPVAGSGMGDMVHVAVADHDDIMVAGTGQQPFGDAKLAKVDAFAARVSAAGKLVWVRAIPDAADIGSYATVAARGATVVVAAQTGEADAKALSLLRPE